MSNTGEQSSLLTRAQEAYLKQFRAHHVAWANRNKRFTDLATAKQYRATSAAMALYLFIMHPTLYKRATDALQAAGKKCPNPLATTHARTATNLSFTQTL